MPSGTGRPLIVSRADLVVRDAVVRADLLIEQGRIVRIGPGPAPHDARVLDGTGLTCGPGLIDIHVHGGGGYTFFTRDRRQLAGYAAWAPRKGVTAFAASLVGDDPASTDAMLKALAASPGHPQEGATLLGFHLEGPFINPRRHGAFPPSMLRAPSVAEFEGHQAAADGHVRMVTLAPELPGALDVVRAVTASDAVAAMGHTDATAAEARAGFAAGISHVTHLFNAMRPIHQREGGPIIAALQSDVSCELIFDGAHVVPDVLRFAVDRLGPDRTVVVTDNLALAGSEQTTGDMAGPVTVEGAVARRADGTIAGSIATMDQHLRNAVEFLGVDLPFAFRLCSTNPARVIGERDRGVIEEGAFADLVLLDGDLNVAATLCGGEPAYLRDPSLLRPAG